MNELTDTINILNLEAWNAIDTGVFSYIKTPFQQTFFSSNSDVIGKALRQSIIYFAETLNTVDRAACILGNEFRTSRTHKYQVVCSPNEKIPETTAPMEITTYAPIAFDYMRSVIGITRNDFHSSFNDGELINFANTGRSGSQMYKTQDDVYVIKTLRDHEAKLLIQILSGFYLRYSNTSSLLTRYVGLYSVNIRSVLPSEIYCVVMLNNLPSIVDIHELYDLKGSTVGRYASIDFPSKRLKALKDLDFQSFYPLGIRIPHEIYRRLRITLESDILELRKLMITDFSLMLGVYQLDETIQDKENQDENFQLKLKPQLGVSSLFAAANIDRAALTSSEPVQTSEKIEYSKPKLINKFIMKPLHLIACPTEDTFNENTIATSLLGIPGVTHDGRRVLMYPALIDCLQTFDSFKRMQHAIQNMRDSKRGAEYSVIHPDEYEKRLLAFLFDKVFIDSKQSLDELLTSPLPFDNLLQSNGHQECDNQRKPRESYEIIDLVITDPVEIHNEQVTRTTEIIQGLTVNSITTTNIDQVLTDSTSL